MADAADIQKQRRPWFINGDFLLVPPTGVARQAREVTLALDALMAAEDPLTEGIDLQLIAPQEPLDLPLRSIGVTVVPEYRRPRLPQFWVQFQLPRHAPGGLLSFCNLAPIAHGKQIVCIHDMQTVIAPDSYSFAFRWLHRLVLPAVGRRARYVTTVSQMARDDIVKTGVARREKIAVIYSAVGHLNQKGAEPAPFANDGRRYVMCFARNEHHKNIELMWKLAPYLERMGLEIVMPGSISAAAVSAHGSPPPANIRLLGRVSDDELANIYRGAECYLLPSRTEGFALTAIEAMSLGCPVVASDQPSMPESCGDAALFAHPDDVGGWSKAVERIQADASLRRNLIAKGHARAAMFDWLEIAREHLRLMRNVDLGLPTLLTSGVGVAIPDRATKYAGAL